MKKRIGLLAILVSLALPFGVRSAEKPMIRLQAQSVEALHSRIRGLYELSKTLMPFMGAMEAEPPIGEGVPAWQDIFRLKKFDQRLLPGVDLSKPILFYADVDAGLLRMNFEKTAAVLLIPILAEKDFFELLKRHEIAAKLDKEGLYTLSIPDFPLPAYLRFQKNHACVSLLTSKAIEPANIVDPAVLNDPKQTAALVLDVRADRIPVEFKDIASNGFSGWLDEVKKETDREPSIVQVLHKHLDSFARRIQKQVWGEAKDLTLSLDIDSKTGDGLIGLLIDGQPASSLFKEIAAYKAPVNRFGSLAKKEATGSAFLRMPLFAPELREMFTEMIDTASKSIKADDAIPEGVEMAKLALARLRKSVQSGNIDAVAMLSPPNKDNQHTAIFSIGIEEADKLKPAIAKWVKAAEFDKFVKVDAVKIQGLDAMKIPMKDFLPQDRESKNVFACFGGEPTLHVAFAKDAIHMAVGPDAEKWLGEAIAAKPAPVVPIEFALFGKHFASFLRTASGGQVPGQFLAGLEKAERLNLMTLTTDGGSKLKMELRSTFFMFSMMARGVAVQREFNAAPAQIIR